MRRALCLCLALGGGCYPWVDGEWADYELTDEVQVVGSAVLTDRLGGYWAADVTEAEIWWGWLGAPEPDLFAPDMVAPAGAGCARGEPTEAVLTDLLADPGASVSQLRGAADLELPFDDLDLRFEAVADALPAGAYDLDPVLGAASGVLEAESLCMMPPGVGIEGPPLAGPTVADGTLDDLVFTWDPSTAAADWVMVEARVSGLTSSGYSPYEWAVCLVPFEDGELTVAPVLWSDTERAEAVYVFMGTLTESLEPVGDRGFWASTVSVRRSVGILRL